MAYYKVYAGDTFFERWELQQPDESPASLNGATVTVTLWRNGVEIMSAEIGDFDPVAATFWVRLTKEQTATLAPASDYELRLHVLDALGHRATWDVETLELLS